MDQPPPIPPVASAPVSAAAAPLALARPAARTGLTIYAVAVSVALAVSLLANLVLFLALWGVSGGEPSLVKESPYVEEQLPEKANVEIVGEYQPRPFGFGTFSRGLKPRDHALEPATNNGS